LRHNNYQNHQVIPFSTISHSLFLFFLSSPSILLLLPLISSYPLHSCIRLLTSAC
jgi:hypothetical protein